MSPPRPAALLALAWVHALSACATSTAPPPDAPQPEAPPGHAALDERLIALRGGARLELERLEDREDADGAWTLSEQTWRLPPGEDPALRASALAEALRQAGATEVYLTRADGLEQRLRVYVGKRATHALRLLPTLGPAPAPRERPELALVLLNFSATGPGARALLEAPVPFSAVVEPYSPFALRHSRDAIRADVELLVSLDPDPVLPEDPRRALEVVFHPTGAALTRPLSPLPLGALADRGMLLLDVSARLAPLEVRAAREAGVPVLQPDLALGEHLGDPTELLHLAAARGRLVLTVDALAPAANEALRWLAEGSARVRPVYLSELASAQARVRSPAPSP